MSVEDHKAVVRRFYVEVATGGNLDLIDELATEDMIDHTALAMGFGAGSKGFKKHVKAVRRAVPDFVAEIDRLIGEDDVVVVYWRASGTTALEFLGVPPGRSFTGEAISRLRFDGGRIVEYQVSPGPMTGEAT